MTVMARDNLVENFIRSDELPAADGLPWLGRLRQAGRARFADVGFPTTDEEEWRLTSVKQIAQAPFRMAGEGDHAAGGEAARGYSFGEEASAEIVLINGRFVPEFSRLKDLPRGLTVGSLASAIQSDAGRIEATLGRHARIEGSAFVALNSVYIEDGAYVHIARGTAIDRPIHLLFITVPTDSPSVSHPRVLVIAENGAVASVMESYVGSHAGRYFTNSVTEIVAGADAVIDHCRYQHETLDAFHVSSTHVELGRSANFVTHSATLGAKLTRNDLGVILNGPGADATLNGLVVIGRDQHADNHTLLRHEKPNCPSHELYKYVLDGRASGVFRGKIFVQKDAQKTDSKQTSKSLLLSDEAVMDSQPALEIYADDVKCTHGSTTGPVDEEMVFYLRTRGVGLAAARHLLTYAFAADITRRIRVEAVRRRIEDYLAAQHGLPQDLRITELGHHDEAAR